MNAINLSPEAYTLLRSMRNGPRRHFKPEAGGELYDLGLAKYEGLTLVITESGKDVPRLLGVNG